jgi:predicted aspartyl protease
MPLIDLRYEPRSGSVVVSVGVRMSTQESQRLGISANTLEIRKFTGLVDTGASVTAIPEDIAKELRLISRSQTRFLTGNGAVDKPVYQADIFLYGESGDRVHIPNVGVTTIRSIEQRPYQGLVGRTVTNLGQLTIIGGLTGTAVFAV